MDLAGSGRLDVVSLVGARSPASSSGRPTPTSSRCTGSRRCPELDWSDPNVTFIDVTGDGLADILITERRAVHGVRVAGRDRLRHRAAGARPLGRGAGPGDRPRRRHADHLHGRHVRRRPDRHRPGPQRRGVLLAEHRLRPVRRQGDDGPGAAVRQRRTCSTRGGSGWPTSTAPAPPTCSTSGPRRDRAGSTSPATAGRRRRSSPCFPTADELSTVQAIDLLGTGTACLVWSSPLPGDSAAPLRYVDLMGGQQAAPADRRPQQPGGRDARQLRAVDPVLRRRRRAPAARG